MYDERRAIDPAEVRRDLDALSSEIVRLRRWLATLTKACALAALAVVGFVAGRVG